MRLEIEQVINKYKDRLYIAALTIVRNHSDAEDIVQESFIKYYKSDTEFQSEEHLKAWLITITVNRAKDMFTSFWRRNSQAWEEYMDAIPFETQKETDLFHAVMKLKKEERTVIHLYYYEDYSVKEISQILKMKENTVKSHLSRARAHLKIMLKEGWQDDE